MRSLGRFALNVEPGPAGYVEKVEIFVDGKPTIQMKESDARDLAKMLADWYHINCLHELADTELCNELSDRGYSGTLKLEREIEI